MLFSYIVGHVPVNFRKKILKNEEVINKIQKYRVFYTPYSIVNTQGEKK